MASSITLPDFDFSNEDAEGEDYDEDEEYGDEDAEGYDDGEDIDAEAEEMARRLGDQLLADIAKAQAEVAAATGGGSTAPQAQTHPSQPAPSVTPQTTHRKRQGAALLTMKAILALASKNPVVQSAMSTLQVPGDQNTNLFDVFNRCISASAVSKPLARTLTEVVLALAKSDVLFGSLRNSDAPALQLDKGKRKRDQADEGGRQILADAPPPPMPSLGFAPTLAPVPAPAHPHKRIAVAAAVDQPDLLHLLGEAVRVISHALSSTPGPRPSIEPALISSIQLQLHQVFLFAVTSTPRAVDGRMPALQELAGLVQMLGVLSGIHIGNPTMPPPPHWHIPPGAAPPPPDIGTAVYPCLAPGCNKTFHRLYSLRTHQRFHTLEHRPYKCMQCPASFVRNHDLKRHALLHEKKAWRCAGCNKIFSRRDAIKRHKDKDARGRGKSRSGEADPIDTACAYAEIEEVEVDKGDGDEELSRRAKLWNGIAATSAGGMTMGEHAGPEEGEIDPGIIFEAQNIVLSVHGLLQVEVSKGLGPPAAPAPMPVPHLSQSTLASIIARAQQTVVPQEIPAALPSEASAAELPAEEPMVVDVPLAPHLDAPTTSGEHTESSSTPPPLSLSWLSEEQTKLLEQAIAQAASAAQAQAEAEAALEEEDEEFDEDEEFEGPEGLGE
ncbi:hypothetical protein C8Q78DRAFT_1193722 [Trametes maxima]|nr:hypothetical protein C8Q78DRAFT_1193722 [Trametes maxima]